MPNRTICLRVAEVIEGGTKQEFYADLRRTLDLSRRTANKVVSLCIAADTNLMDGEKSKPKFGTYKKVYGDFVGIKSVVASICRSVETKYSQERWHVANGRKSICNYRSFPWPLLCNKSCKMFKIKDQGEFLVAELKLHGGDWTVRLAGGSNYRDQIRGIRSAMQSGKIGDSKIWTDRKHIAVIGVSVALPDAPAKRLAGTLNVSTGRDTLILATKARTDRPFAITGDEIARWVTERERKYYRLSQDRKSGVNRKKIKALQRRVGDKWKCRMDTYVHQITARIVEHAIRRKVAILQFDGTIKSFAEKFPWHDLETKLAYKCEDAGIEFRSVTQTVKEPDVSKPHIYFKYSPETGRVKIGKTSLSSGKRHVKATDSPDRNLTILAVDNQPKTKLTQREKHFHALFAAHRLDSGEWFNGEPIVHWLREAGWFGNAGNLSQIAQVLPMQGIVSDYPGPKGSVSVPDSQKDLECSQYANKCTGYLQETAVAP